MSQNLLLEIREHLREEILSAKFSLVGPDKTCNILGSFLEAHLDTIMLFQAFFDQIVWGAITQRRPGSIPVKLGRAP